MLNRRQSHRVPTRLRDDKSYATHLDNQSYQTEMHIIKDTVLSYE